MSQIEKFPEFLMNLPEVELPFSGAQGWLIKGNEFEVVLVEFTETCEVSEHTHAAQWELVISGKVELRMKDESIDYGPGGNFFIPAGVPHGATVYAGYRAIIFFNEKNRYKQKG
jgi:mannose-6-phosphate isomerase-like protein (cupin superfamily)